MAMTREEERELRLNSSIGSLLGSLSTRPDLVKPPPEESTEEGDSEGGVKRNAEDQGDAPSKKAKDPEDPEEVEALEFYSEETPDFDEDDPDYVKQEKKFLVEEFGKKIVTLGFDERDRFLYNCEVCGGVEFTSRKMLASHCHGMKHLKRKNLLERKLQGKDVPDTFKVTKSNYNKPSKPSGRRKYQYSENDSEEPSEKKKWQEHKNKWQDNKNNKWQDNKNNKWQQQEQQNNYNNYYGQGDQGFYNQPPQFGPQSGPPGFQNGPPPGPPPPNYYGQWGPPPQNMFNTPPPVAPAAESKGTGKDSLAGGDTGSLLQKLADCAVKNDKDSDLAINVVIALMKSLKDFNHKRGETKFIEVLTEADVTFRVLKTLKPGNKDSDDSTQSPSGAADQTNDTSSASVSDVAQGAPASKTSYPDVAQGAPASKPSYPDVAQGPPASKTSYPDNSQYYNSQNNNGYSYGGGSNYSSSAPTGVPPPSGYNMNGAGGYGPDNNFTGNQNYPNQGYNNSGYYNQGQGNQNPNPYSYPGAYNPQGTAAPQNTQGSDEQGQKAAANTNQASSSVAPPPPPPPPPPPGNTTDNSTPDFSNYGYAAGYSMGYYNVPPPQAAAYTNPYKF